MPKRKRTSSTFSSRKRRTRITAATKRYVQRVVASNIETKFKLTSFSSLAIPDGSSGGYDLVLSAVGQGDTQNLRDGNQLFLTGIWSRLWVTLADSTNILRVILYIPKANVDDTLGAGTVTVRTAIDADKYTILSDRLIFLNTSRPQRSISVKRKFAKGKRKGMRITFDGPLSTDLAKNPLKLYIVSDSGAVTHPVLDGSIRTYFKDA